MRIPFWTAIYLLFSACIGISQDTDRITQETKHLIEQIANQAARQSGWDEPATVVENSSALKKKREFLELQSLVQKSWRPTLIHFQTVAPTDISKTILIVAMQSTSPEEYLQFLDQSCDLAGSRALDKRLLKFALFPAGKNLRGLLDATYDKPITKSILQKVRLLYAGDANMVQYCDAVLSGETQKTTRAYYNDNPQESRPSLFPESLSSPSTGQTSVPYEKRPKKGLWVLGIFLVSLLSIGVWHVKHRGKRVAKR